MTKSRVRQWTGGALALVLGGIGALGTARAAVVQEPPTVFYGRIVGTGSTQPFLVTEGELQWTVRRATGGEVVLKARLWPQKDGEFSYRLDVPHEVLATGLTTSSGTVPLKKTEETHAIGEIRVNGVRARIAGDGSEMFAAAQARRASSYRVDLEVPIAAPDADEDGLPDWWEKQHGGELEAEGDLDGDGLTNLAEYRAGTDPRRDSRRPALVSPELRAYADATTGLLLRARDADTAAEGLVYTLTRPPTGSELRLRNARPSPEAPDVVLAAGATFTQRDIHAGRLVLVHAGESTEPASFEVALTDGTTGFVPSPTEVRVTFYRPTAEQLERLAATTETAASISLSGGVTLTTDESRRIRQYLLGRDQGAVIRDGAAESEDLVWSAPSSALDPEGYGREYVPRYGADRPQVLAGGRGDDTLTGGMADDVLSGGAGENRLVGGGGGDRFRVEGGGGGTDVLADFRPEEGDVIDLASCLDGTSKQLRDYVRVRMDGATPKLELDVNGDGGGFTDRTLVLAGVTAAAADLHDLVESGSLVVGGRALPPRISVAASQAVAAENGPRAGEFRLRRTGSMEQALTVDVAVRGSAANGVDFVFLSASVRFAAGEPEARLVVEPFPDSQAEPAETVELSVEPGEGYEVAAASGRALVSIADLQPVVKLEALESLATTRPLAAGSVLLSREAVIDRSLLVRLDIRGSAANGVDYQTISKFVHLNPGQSSTLITIQPNATTSGSDLAKSVQLSVVPDAAYLVAEGGQAEVLLVPERMDFATWRTRHYPGSSGTPATFGAADPGSAGIANALRYAFGMDPAKPDRARMPKLVVRDGHLTLDVWRRAGAEDLEFVAEVSSDLKSWSAAGDKVERVRPAEHAGNPEVICFRMVPSLKDAPQLFLNVRVKIRQ